MYLGDQILRAQTISTRRFNYTKSDIYIYAICHSGHWLLDKLSPSPQYIHIHVQARTQDFSQGGGKIQQNITLCARSARGFFTPPPGTFLPPLRESLESFFHFLESFFFTMRINALPNALGNALFPFGAEAQGGGITPFTPPLNTRLYIYIYSGGYRI